MIRSVASEIEPKSYMKFLFSSYAVLRSVYYSAQHTLVSHIPIAVNWTQLPRQVVSNPVVIYQKGDNFNRMKWTSVTVTAIFISHQINSLASLHILMLSLLNCPKIHSLALQRQRKGSNNIWWCPPPITAKSLTHWTSLVADGFRESNHFE